MEGHMLVGLAGNLCRHQRHASTHSQVGHQGRIPIQVDQKILCPAAHTTDRASGRQPLQSPAVNRLSERAVPDLDPLDRVSNNQRFEAPPQNLDFRKLGHRPIVPSAALLDRQFGDQVGQGGIGLAALALHLHLRLQDLPRQGLDPPRRHSASSQISAMQPVGVDPL